MSLYGYGMIGLAALGLTAAVMAILHGWREREAGERIGAAKQHADEVHERVSKALAEEDDQAVQDALEAELIRSRQPKP